VFRSEQLRFGPLREGETPQRVPAADCLFLAACHELLKSELADGLEHEIPWFRLDRFLEVEQGRIHKRRNPRQDSVLEIVRLRRNRLGRLERESASEDRQALEKDLFAIAEELMAPGNGIAHGAKALR